jgi:hypothetical protein
MTIAGTFQAIPATIIFYYMLLVPLFHKSCHLIHTVVIDGNSQLHFHDLPV